MNNSEENNQNVGIQEPVVNTESFQNQNVNLTNKNDRLKAIVIGVLVLVAFGGFAFAFFYNKHSGDEKEYSATDIVNSDKKDLDIVFFSQDKKLEVKVFSSVLSVLGKNASISTLSKCSKNIEKNVAINDNEFSVKFKGVKYSMYQYCSMLDDVKGLISGRSKNAGAVIILNATDSIKAETNEYVRILHEVGITDLIVYVNGSSKDYKKSESKINKLLVDNGFGEKDISIIVGNIENKEVSKKLLNEINKNFEDSSAVVGKDLFMRVDDAFTYTTGEKVLTGHIDSGEVKVKDNVEIVKSNKTVAAQVLKMELFGKSMDTAIAGDNVGITIKDSENTKFEQGDVIATKNTVKAYKRIEVIGYILTKDEQSNGEPIENNSKQGFYIGVKDYPGTINLSASNNKLMPGSYYHFNVELETAVAIRKGELLNIRSNGVNIGAGRVVKMMSD